jgi:hypothetical protein
MKLIYPTVLLLRPSHPENPDRAETARPVRIGNLRQRRKECRIQEELENCCDGAEQGDGVVQVKFHLAEMMRSEFRGMELLGILSTITIIIICLTHFRKAKQGQSDSILDASPRLWGKTGSIVKGKRAESNHSIGNHIVSILGNSM